MARTIEAQMKALRRRLAMMTSLKNMIATATKPIHRKMAERVWS